MSGRNRNELTILRDIVEVCKMPNMKQTHIMYKTNISAEQIYYYIPLAITSGFIQQYDIIEDNGKGRHSIVGKGYRATEHGRKYITDLNDCIKRVIHNETI